MSCQTRLNQSIRTSGAGAGIGSLAGRMAGVVGRSATAVLRAAESFDGPRRLERVGGAAVALEAGALLASAGGRGDLPAWAARWQRQRQGKEEQRGRTARRVRQRALLGLGLLKLGQAASAAGGTGLARLSRREQSGLSGGLEQRFFFPNTTRLPVRIWPSRLTPLLNRLDAGVTPIRRSEGRMFEVRGTTWHRGTTVVETATGERTITHVQSLALPANHYYFNRRLSDNETVGLVSGQKGFEPKYIEGYAGQVSGVEALCPAWARLKQGLIQAHLRWGEPDGEQKAARQRTDRVNPLDGVQETVRLNGREYPVMVRRVAGGLAEATYYNEEAGAWQAVEDKTARRRLARRVEAGQIEPWETEGPS